MHEFTLTEIIIIIVISALHHESEALPYNVALCVRDCVCVCARCDVRTHHIESLKDFKDKVRLAAEENCMRIQRGVLDRFLHCAAEFLEAESIEFLVHLQPCEFELISTWHLARDKGVNRRQPLLACNVQKRNRSNTRIKEHTRSSHLISSRQSVSLSLSLPLSLSFSLYLSSPLSASCWPHCDGDAVMSSHVRRSTTETRICRRSLMVRLVVYELLFLVLYSPVLAYPLMYIVGADSFSTALQV